MGTQSLKDRIVAGLLVAAGAAGCNALLGNEQLYLASQDAGIISCLLTSECPEGNACIFKTCSPPCAKDVDCPEGRRCLETGGRAACVAASASCTDGCPSGAECIEDECRTACSGGTGCRTDQVCLDGACIGEDGLRDPRADDLGGAGGASGGSGGGGGGGASGGATSGSGGSPGAGGSLGAGGGGAPGGGGAQGAGGSEMGGASGSGGASSGGAPGSGGTASGGTQGSGGAASGGAASGGAQGSGGAPPTGLIRGPAPTLSSASTAGPYTVQTYTSGYRDGPSFGAATVYHATNATPPFASVAIVSAFVSSQTDVATWGPFLASHGIVTMTIDTNTPQDQPSVRSTALLDAIETLRQEHTRNAGPLFGDMDLTRFGVMGWSMGGGGALIAASSTPSLRAAVTLCAWNPGSTYPTNQVPTLLLAGAADTLAPGQSEGFYTSMPAGTLKMLLEIAGGSHNIANNPVNASGVIGRYGLSWLKVFLEGDDRYRQFLEGAAPANASMFMTTL